MNVVTVLGASGFIGSNLVNRLKEIGIPIFAPNRDVSLTGRYLGDVIFAIGLTADFRGRPYDTVEAHVCKLLEVVKNSTFSSFTYLSSTRVYNGLNGVVVEAEELRVSPYQGSDLYNITKLAGEALLFSTGLNVRIVRLSNVYGYNVDPSNFFNALIHAALKRKHIVLQSSLLSEKDYISINDTVDMLIKIATCGKDNLYNLASGYNVSHGELVKQICKITGSTFEVVTDAPTIQFPVINIEKIKNEFAFQPSNILDDISQVVGSTKLKGIVE